MPSVVNQSFHWIQDPTVGTTASLSRSRWQAVGVVQKGGQRKNGSGSSKIVETLRYHKHIQGFSPSNDNARRKVSHALWSYMDSLLLEWRTLSRGQFMKSLLVCHPQRCWDDRAPICEELPGGRG
eukprot:6475221-Amphidinium_carterae.1